MDINEKSNLLPVCFCCGQTPPDGIMGGIFLRRRFLCRQCEEYIANLTVESNGYDVTRNNLLIIFS